MILERDENGFFDKVVTVHPLAYKKEIVKLDDRHTLYEFDLRKLFHPVKMILMFPLFVIKFLFMIRELMDLIRKEKIDLIRATDPYLMGLLGWVLSRLTRIPFCISIHTDYDIVFALDPRVGFKKFLRICSKWIPDFVSPRAGFIMPISHYLKRAVSKRVKKERIKVIPHGVNFDFSPVQDLKAKFSLPPNKKIISFVARLSKDNYIDDILQMVEKLILIRDDFIVVMAGSGEMDSHIRVRLSLNPRLKSVIWLIGAQPNHIGRSLRYISDISLCLMSGFSLIEAAAAGSPLIAYDVEWHGEVVENHVTGFLIREHQVDSLVESVDYLLNHPNEAAMMGENARKKVYQNHDIQKTSCIKQSYYMELLK